MRWILFFFTLFSLSGRQIEISGKILEVEIADTPEKHARGLMGRTLLEEGKGMLFVYDKAQRLSFWMKNTLVPLSIAFLTMTKLSSIF